MNRSKTTTTRSRKSVSSSGFLGHRTSPSEVPPVINTNPWNNVVLIHRMAGGSGKTVITFDTLRTDIKSQCGFSNVADQPTGNGSINFEIRLQSISCWSTSDAPLSLYPLDLIRSTATDTVELARLDSFPMKNMYARVGYVFPGSIQAIPFSTIRDKAVKIAVIGCTGSVELHIHLMWRGAFTSDLTLGYIYPEPDYTSTRHLSLSEDEFCCVNVPDRILGLEQSLNDLRDLVANSMTKLSLSNKVDSGSGGTS